MDDPATRASAVRPDCCATPACDPRIARRFDDKAQAWTDASEFPLVVDVTGRLLDALSDATLIRPTVAELGCGTGGLVTALLELGASRVSGVDLSPASIEVARRRVADGGFGAQASFQVADAAHVSIQVHDWVILDRVICCYGDADALLAKAIRTAASRIALSIPESRGWRGLVNRPLWALESLWDTLRGGCRGYVHDARRLERQLMQAGFQPARGSGHLGLWFVGIYERRATDPR